ncbi:MAG: UvrD-helicase domain-containing protein [Pseudomonadota bacterium]
MSDVSGQQALAADQHARAQAIDPERSWVVRAPAGSGKTELLIQRYLALLARCEQPEQVLAITFTVKAAAEMRERVIGALQRAEHTAPPTQPHARRTWDLANAVVLRDRACGWRLTLTPARLRIQTIDALCMHIASRHPLSARLVGIDAISERPDVLYGEAARALFERWAGRDPADGEMAPEQRLLEHLDGDQERAIVLVAHMLSVRDRWLRHVVGGVAGLARVAWRELLEDGLQAVCGAYLQRLHRLVPSAQAQELQALAIAAGAALTASGSDSPITACADLQSLAPGEDLSQSLAIWRGVRELLLTRQGDLRAQVSQRIGFPAPRTGDHRATAQRERMRELLQALGPHQAFLTHLHGLARLPAPAYGDSQWQLVDALMQLLPRAVAHLKIVFGERGEVDFTEVSHAALRALDWEASNEDAATLASATALDLDEQVRHILVDEFQDTSHPQLALLRGLTNAWASGDGERTLFVVGDPMQSIYRFRDAQVQLFAQVQRHGVGELALPSLQLRRNFRSNAALVRWVNEAMTAVESAGAADGEVGRVRFEASEPVREGAVGAHVTLALQGEHSREAEAKWVVERVRAALDEPASTVAVLVRARDHLAHVLPALRAARLRYVGVEIEPLRDTLEVRDVHALTRALWHLGDRAAWLTVLRAPWCGMSLHDLHALVLEDRGRTVWDCVIDQRGRARLSEDGRRRLSRVKGVLADAWRQRGSASLRDSVEGAWTAMGGAATLRSEQALANVHRYFDLLDQVDRTGRLRDLAPLERGLAALYAEPDPRADGRLQVMTMHKSKGLEFDVVVIPGLGATPRVAPRALLEVGEVALHEIDPNAGEGSRLLVGPIGTRRASDPIGDYLRGRERQLDRDEALRLAYVALTRAREALHLSGELRPPNNSSPGGNEDGQEEARPAPGSLLALLEPGLRATALWTVPTTATGQIAEEPLTALAQTLHRLPSDWSLKRMPVPEVVRVPRPSLAEESVLLPREGAGEVARHVGRVVHWVLARMAAQRGPLPAPADEAAALNRRVVDALHRAGLRADPLLDAARRALTAIRATLEDTQGRWALGEQGSQVQAGWGLSGWLEGRAVSARVDLSFLVGDVRWLVELRTSEHQGGGVEQFLQAEARNVGRELQLAMRLAEMLETEREHRAGVYFPMLGEWREIAPTAQNSDDESAD